MEKTLYMAAMEGNVDVLREVRDREIENGCWDNFIQSLTPQKNNIIHIACQYDQLEFLRNGFDFMIFTHHLISQRNANGDTPIHVASKRGNKDIVKLLVEISKKFVLREVLISSEVVEEIVHEEEPKWAFRITNSMGNTPLHQALINGKLEVAKYLIDADPHVATLVNNHRETPLHLAIKYNVDGEKKFAIDMVDKLNKQRPSLSYNTECCSWSAKDLDGSSLIQILLQRHREAVYVTDSDGLTPVLRAAVQSQLRAIETILNECPESSEVCDPEGKTILHLLPIQSYEEAKSCLKIRQISALKDQQDKFGNTPAHLAVMNCKEKIIMQEKEQEKKMLLIEEKNNESIDEDRKVFVEERKVFIEDQHIGMIRALLESFANFTIKNKEGHSAAALFQSLIPYFPSYNNGTLFELDTEIKEMLTKNKEMMLLAPNESISTSKDDHRKIWEAVEHPDLDLLRKEVKVLESWLSNGLLRIGDLLKILLQECNNKNSKETHKINHDEVEQFMIQLLDHNPVLLCQTNLRGDTFLHTMARDEHYEMSESFSNQIYNLAIGCETERSCCPPWKIRNVEGNTPLHEALMNAPKPKIVKFLLTCDNDVATYVNNKIETPLHALCRAKGKKIDEDVITMIIEANIQVTYHRDSEGLTPLLKAAKEGKIGMVKKICKLSSNSAQLRDHSGKTFWHLMNMTDATDENEKDLGEIHKNSTELADLITAKDVYGNTSLRSAIVNKHSKLAEYLANNVESSASKRVYRKLQKEDRDMQYHLFLLKVASWLPEKMERTLMRKFDEVGRKSIFGVPEESIKDYINTMGVIAVLTATVAIEAAFQPPNGGIHLEDPIIIRAAYWIFMVSNILTVCSSIIVLFSLMWVLTGDRTDRLVVTDLSILLLQGSFISAMISVMTGVFSLNYKNTPRLAIFAVVICSSTLLVLHKFIVMNFLQFVFLTGYLVYEIFTTAISGLLCRKDDKKIGNNDNEK